MTYLECLSKLSSCLQSMLKNCQEKNWSLLSENEKEREDLVNRLKSLKPDQSDETIKLIQTVIDLNNKVISAADDNKNESEKALLDIRRNMKKTARYYSE